MSKKAEKHNLRKIVTSQQEATWGKGNESRKTARVPGIISGDIGKKGEIAAQLRAQSISDRRDGTEAPFRANIDGTERALLLLMLLIAGGLITIIGVIIWLLA